MGTLLKALKITRAHNPYAADEYTEPTRVNKDILKSVLSQFIYSSLSYSVSYNPRTSFITELSRIISYFSVFSMVILF